MFQRIAVDPTVPKYLPLPFPHTLEGPGHRITKHSLDQGDYLFLAKCGLFFLSLQRQIQVSPNV